MFTEIPLGHMQLLIHHISKFKTQGNPEKVMEDITADIQSTDSFLSLYKYESPMEEQLNKVNTNIKDKENDIKLIKHKIEEIQSVGKNDLSHLELRPTCSQCHQCLKHKLSKCQHEPCSTWLQCGRIELHKAEKKNFESKKGKLKRLLRDLSTLESEAKRLKDIMDSEVRSFTNIVEPHLICSNPHKYLTNLNGNILPVTRTINIDLVILKKTLQFPGT